MTLTTHGIKELARRYGSAVAVREHASRFGGGTFQYWNLECLSLWRKLIAAGAYQDEACSDLHDQYKPAYYDGLYNSIVTDQFGKAQINVAREDAE